ncbi:immunoglobulin superfamily DCC subclass member 4-like isoform X2 [Corticium candelabrum]|uniref:immunoglobulin superfamily DCC subclass member 4-like isoform X2 n=1 Tax=Corticium candelabrum TaxID=121492 RepID=UPI002E2619A2|nr:immunoglobulin superfamily DCC subclass member 4-like isoform X2 [Corticium candelabrum]
MRLTPEVEPVKIVVPPHDITVGPETKNLAAVFVCGASGFPNPHITWLRHHRPLLNTPNILEVQSAGGMSLLTVSSPNATDAGVYTCVADNGKSSPILSKAKLEIKKAPKPKKPTKPPPTNTSQQVPMFCHQTIEEHYILTEGCRSSTKVKNRRCHGMCSSDMQVYPTLEINCQSCRGSVSYQSVLMVCRDGTARYVRTHMIRGCRCRACKLNL